MKKKIGLSFIAICLSIACYSQSNRVLTEEERQSLLTNEIFLEKCRFAIRNYASFWSTDNGSSSSNEAARIKWAKDRKLSVDVLRFGTNDPHTSEVFINASKAKQYSLFSAPQNVTVLLTAWDSASSFDEFVSVYYDILGSDIRFSVTN